MDTKRKRHRGLTSSGVNDELVKRGWLHDYGKGQVAYSGPVLKLARLINDKAGELYASALGAKDAHFPAMIDADTLHKCGYFDSHPNAVTFVGNVVEDFDAIEEFRLANSAARKARSDAEAGTHPHRRHVSQSGSLLSRPTRH